MTTQKRLFIIDTDPGIDDARCLLFMLNKTDIEVLAITTVAGNSYNVMTSYNAGVILEIVKKSDIPVYQGSKHNFLGDTVTGGGYHGDNGLGDIQLPVPGKARNRDMKSWEALIQLSKKHPSQITLVALGPLTNLAMAFMYDPSFPNRFKKIFIMGSDRAEKTWKNMSTYAEFNTFCDPVAANLVYKTFRGSESGPIYLLDWYFCCTHQLPGNFYTRLAEELKKKGRTDEASIFLSKGDDTASTNEAVQMEVHGGIVADEFATLAAYDETLITNSELITVNTCLEGEKYGHTSFAPATGGNVRMIKDMDMERFYKTFYSAFDVTY